MGEDQGEGKQNYVKGRGAQVQPENRFREWQVVTEHIEGLDEPLITRPKTQVTLEHPKTIVNPVTSPDIGIAYSLNPYQGCEHGCSYCYARNSHEYYGFSAGLDFETKLMAKPDAPKLLEKHLLNPNWKAAPISLSGNTDCYQPLEKEMEITRKLLKVFSKYRHPVGLITKNSLIQRDLDLLQDLAKDRLAQVYISITSLDEDLRRKMEPRTASAAKRLQVIENLSQAGIPVAVMTAPIIPGLNDQEIPSILKAASDHGALSAAMTVIRLNGRVSEIFKDWLQKNYPNRYAKVIHQIEDLHGGKVNDNQFGRRMKGEGIWANMIQQLFKKSKNRYYSEKSMPEFDLTQFRKGGNFRLEF
ncbi:PA0069 family radical SAM protein [Pararhodonellum marinum]|uniref:PA0069 family radical SAM protein n=1 Tax=Pararhodonellum marinum TaxID=2755358 RepID=UPI00188EBC14|nr:PA0069 family radical SAM protein [Pararhodonellum marinum]